MRRGYLLAVLLAIAALSGVRGYRRWAEKARGIDGVSAGEAALPAQAIEVVREALSAAPEPSFASDKAPVAGDQADGPRVAPTFREAAWERMTDDLWHLASRHPGRVAVFLRDLKTNKTWTYHPDDLFPSASLIKVPIMACVLSKIHNGGLSLNDKIVLRRRHRMGGSGTIKWRPDGTKFSVRELLYRMIDDSDNTATAMMIDTLGMGFIQQEFPKLGLFYTEIYPEGMSIKGGRVTQENYTTAREMTMLLEKIYRGEVVDKASSELMMDILKHRRATTSRLAKGLPPGWAIAHKTGLLRQACHDSAIILAPNGDYALTVLTGQNHSYKAAKEFISRLGRVTYRHYLGEDYLAKASRRSISL